MTASTRHRVLAASYRALHDAYRDPESVFAGVMADRADWEAATRAQRHLAVAADAELRRRHPQQRFTPLRSAEPQAVTPTWKRRIDSSPVHPGSGEVTAMAAIGITGMGLTGVVRMNWVQDAPCSLMTLTAAPPRGRSASAWTVPNTRST
jgi:hypothetical protein